MEHPVTESATTVAAVDELSQRFFEWFLER